MPLGRGRPEDGTRYGRCLGGPDPRTRGQDLRAEPLDDLGPHAPHSEPGSEIGGSDARDPLERPVGRHAVRGNPEPSRSAPAPTFLARGVDVYTPHLREVLKRAGEHKGTAIVEILQNCNIFNDGAWDSVREKEHREDNLLHVRHGEPLIFGKNKDMGIRMKNPFAPGGVHLGRDVTEKDLVVHDENGPAAYAFMLAQMEQPNFPLPIGVFRNNPQPSFDEAMAAHYAAVVSQKGEARVSPFSFAALDGRSRTSLSPGRMSPPTPARSRVGLDPASSRRRVEHAATRVLPSPPVPPPAPPSGPEASGRSPSRGSAPCRGSRRATSRRPRSSGRERGSAARPSRGR